MFDEIVVGILVVGTLAVLAFLGMFLFTVVVSFVELWGHILRDHYSVISAFASKTDFAGWIK